MTTVPPPNTGPPRWRWPWAVETPVRRAPPLESAAPAGPAAVASDDGGLFDSNPDPVLVLRAGSSREPTDWRFVLANPAARELFRIQRAEGSLVTVLRDPVVLEAVGRCLFGGEEAEADHAAGERYVALRVTDAGPGMAREHLPRLSERFYRVEGQKSGERSGTGLGLAIVKHIINRHRGGLVVESQPGAGATFTAFAPMAKPAVPGAL